MLGAQRRSVTAVFALLLFACGTSFAEPGRVVVVYDRQNYRLSVDAQDVPLELVLLEVSSKTSVMLESRNKALLHEHVSLTLERMPLDRALAELVGRYNAVFSYAPAPT